MTFNGVIALILIFFSPNSIALQADYVTVVEDGPIMSVKYCLAVPVFHFWPKLNHPAARSLRDLSYLLLLGVLITFVTIMVKIDQETRPWECSQTDTLTDTRTRWQTQTGCIICHSDVNETLRSETEKRPRPRPSKIFSRPRSRPRRSGPRPRRFSTLYTRKYMFKATTRRWPVHFTHLDFNNEQTSQKFLTSSEIHLPKFSTIK